MSSAFQQSCLVIVFGCLLQTGQAQSNAEFTIKARQMLAIFGNPSVDSNTKSRNLPALVEFYEKYYNRLQTNQERANANNVVQRYRAQKVQTVDGVPAQGGFWLVLPLLLPFVASIVEGIARAVAN
ncbi:protein Turandot F [Drosophila gunungcola]|nr:protein Turandot F [Drosophila gunungcola]